MSESFFCYRCGSSLDTLPMPLGRLEECPSCTMQVHVCRMCIFFDSNVPKQCWEDDAEEVKEKERANFCDYFKPNPDAHDPKFARDEAKARPHLDALFGGEEATDDPDDATKAAEDLFK